MVVNKAIYEDTLGNCIDKYAEECKKVYLDDEKNLGNGKTKELYKKWLIDEKVIPGFKDIIQVQLITSKNKPCVYYVTSKEDNKKYVLKGPMTGKMKKTNNENRNNKEKIKFGTFKC